MDAQDRREEALRKYQAGLIDRRRFLRGLAVVGIGTVGAGRLLAACAPAEEVGLEEPVGEDVGEDDVAAPDGPQRGGRLIEGYDRVVNPLDPIRTPWADPGMNAIYEPLLTRDFDGQLVPMLATAFAVEDDVWRFEIPDDRAFHSGAPLTPEIVQEAYRRMKDPDTGQNPVFWGAVTDVEVDGNDVLLLLEHPSQRIGETLTTEFAYIPNTDLRNEIGEEAFGAEQADGTGPFQLVDFAPGTRVLVERWDDYPGDGAPFFENRGPAYLDEVEWVPIVEPGMRAAEIETGSVHAVKNPIAADVPRLETNEDLVVLEFPELSNLMIVPNMERTQFGFDDLRVRQAMSHAIDREAIVNAIVGGRGQATYGPVMPGWRYYEPEVEQFNQFDPELADQLLNEAGWTLNAEGVREKDGDLLEFSCINETATIENQSLIAVSGMLQDVGIVMRVRSIEGAAYREQRAEADCWAQKWLWGVPLDVVELFITFFLPADHPDVAASLAAYERWGSATSEEELVAAGSEVQLTLAERLPIIPIYTPNTVWVHHRDVHGWRPNQANLYPFYNDVWLENA